MLSSLESLNPGAHTLITVHGQHRRAGSRIKRGGLGGVKDHGRRTAGFPRNLGGTACLHTGRAVGTAPDGKYPGPWAGRLRPTGANRKTQVWYRETRETK